FAIEEISSPGLSFITIYPEDWRPLSSRNRSGDNLLTIPSVVININEFVLEIQKLATLSSLSFILIKIVPVVDLLLFGISEILIFLPIPCLVTITKSEVSVGLIISNPTIFPPFLRAIDLTPIDVLL